MWSSIRNKIVLFTIVPLTLLYSVIFLFHILESLRVSRVGVEEFMEQQAGHFAGLLDYRIRFIESYGEALSYNLPHTAAPESIATNSAFRRLLTGILKDQAFYAIAMGRPGAGRVFCYGEGGLYDVSWEDTATLVENVWGWSLPFVSPVSGERVVSYKVPGLDNLFFVIKVSGLIKMLQQDNPRNFRFVIVDRKSRFIHSDMRSTRPDDSLQQTASRIGSESLKRLVEGPIREGRRGLETVYFRDWPTWYFASPVPEAGWVLLTHMRETTALSAARQSAYRSVFLLLLVLLVVTACVLKISGFITRPLVQLAGAVDSLGERHWKLKFEHDSEDETGRLARSISAMAKRLGERDETLRELRASNISHIAERLRGRYFYYMLDDQGRLTYISPSVSYILGYAPDLILRKMPTLFVESHDEPAVGKAMAEAVSTVLQGQLQNDAVQVEMVHRNGETRTIEVINVPVVEPGGRISGIEGMGHDISELVSDNRRFRGLLEAAPDAILITDTEELITMVNARAEEMFGYDRQELLGKPLGLLGRKRAGRLLSRREFGSDSRDASVMQLGFETVCRCKSGSHFPAEVTSNPLETDTGTLISIAIRDISDRKSTERDLRKARDKARAADLAKSQFLSNMSHELRTPLNGILGHVQLLLRAGNFAQEQRDSLETVEDCGQHLLLLINDVLDLTKVDTAGARVQLQPVRLRSVLEKICRMLRPKADRKGLKLIQDIDDRLPDAVLMDVTKIRQILINLLGNAVKFTAQGEVQLKVLQDGEQIIYVVSDTGIGIAPEEHEQIFSPFHQVQYSDHPGGTGLGLAISQRLVSTLGGMLKVASLPGAGSRFYFSLPLKKASLECEPKLQPESELSSDQVHPLQLHPEESARVLVVDDSRVNREMMVRLLDDAGFDTLEAVNGQEGLDMIQVHQPELVLMDIRMPVLSGTEAVKRLRLSGNPVPVIAVTASVNPAHRHYFENLGFNGHIGKPFRVDDLFRKIEQVARIRFTRRGQDTMEGQDSSLPLNRADMITMLQELQGAAEVGDVATIHKLVDQLRGSVQRGPLAEQLNDLSRTLSCEALGSLCQELLNSLQSPEISTAPSIESETGDGRQTL